MFVFDFPKKLGYWGIETSHLALVSFGDSTRISHSYKNAFWRAPKCDSQGTLVQPPEHYKKTSWFSLLGEMHKMSSHLS